MTLGPSRKLQHQATCRTCQRSTTVPCCLSALQGKVSDRPLLVRFLLKAAQAFEDSVEFRLLCNRLATLGQAASSWPLQSSLICKSETQQLMRCTSCAARCCAM
jgi:hypothetical protein